MFNAKHWSDVDRWIDGVELVRFVASSHSLFLILVYRWHCFYERNGNIL